VSLASKGRNRLQNTHPFVRTFHSHEVVSSQV
jgi:predicted glutamine amidotransferase